MAELDFKQFVIPIESGTTEGLPATALIFGDGLLCQTALDGLLQSLLPKGRQDLNLEFMDAGEEQIPAVLEKMCTRSFLTQAKVVVLREAKWFYTKKDRGKLVEKARAAFESQNLRQAAANLARFCAQSDLEWEDLSPQNRAQLKLSPTLTAQLTSDPWLDEVLAYSVENNVVIQSGAPRIEMLAEAIVHGFPKRHHLVILADRVLKTHRLYKTIKTHGTIVNCSLPAGPGRADVKARQEMIRERVNQLLAQKTKKMAPDAFSRLLDLTGEDLRMALNAMQKVIDYVGSAPQVTAKDVAAVVSATKEDPLYAFTNAVVERNYAEATRLADRLMATGTIAHPLPLIAAVANQLRRLMIMRDFMDRLWGIGKEPQMPYNRFIKEVVPKAQQVDQVLMEKYADSGIDFSAKAMNSKKLPKKIPKSKIPAELLLAGTGRSHYAGYQLMLKAAKFSLSELVQGFTLLQEIDAEVKTGQVEAYTGLARILLAVCNPNKG